MSRIGKKPIEIPNGVKAELKGRTFAVKGPKGELERELPPEVDVEIGASSVVVVPKGDSRQQGAFHGLARSLLANMVTGVSSGFEKKMQVEGVGYRVAKEGRKLIFSLGYSSPIDFPLPAGIDADVGEKGLLFTIRGFDKELVGQTAAKIRSFRPPEPYKGKGVRYADETVRRKAGKAGAK
jgi:large subunit ribosomal protein L6